MVSNIEVAGYFFAFSLVLLATALFLISKKSNDGQQAKESQPEESYNFQEDHIRVEHQKLRKKYVDEFDTVAKAIEKYPVLEDFLYYNGVKSVKNKIVMATFAKKTTLAGIAKALGKNSGEFLNSVNKYIDDSAKI